MKRLITYISILAAALTVGVSCSQEATISDQEGGSLTLLFRTAEMGTRAISVTDGTPVVGEGAENVIDHVDVFFFEDEDPTSTAIYSERLTTGGKLEKVTDTEYKTVEHFINTDNHPELKGPSYLYVLVNYPEEVTAQTMEDLLALPISTDFTKAQTTFVMDSFDNSKESGLIYLTPKSTAEERVQEVNVARVAAKLVLNMKVKESLTDELGDVWTPVFDQMWVNFLYARKTATVAATPMPFDNKANYFNTDQAMPNGGTLKDGFYEYKTDPIYTYPQEYSNADVTAPYFKIFIPWLSKLKGMNNFYYKIILPEVDKKEGKGYFQRNKIYQFNVEVSVIGGTEDDWALFSDYLYVADWYAPDKIATTVESARYLDVPVKKYEIYGIDQITVPVVSSNDIEIVSCDGVQQKVQETLSDIDDVHGKTVRSISLDPSATSGNRCVPDGSESFSLFYALDPAITTSSNSSFDCTPVKWTVKIKHKASTEEPYLRDKIVTVEIIQYPSIYARLVNGLNSFVNGYYTVQTASVTPKPNTETLNEYYRWGGGTWAGTGNGTSGSANYGGLNVSWTQTIDGRTVRRTSTMTLITVSAFAANSSSYTVNSAGDNQSTKEYIIGDPRVDAGFDGDDLYPYLWGTQTRSWTDAAAGTIKKGSDVQKNLIAPAYMFNSEIAGRPGTSENLNWERAQKRCATYQEAGYPAGRWRLPTEAEIYFAYSLQRMGVIDNLFNGGDGYWASSGNCFADNSDLGQGTQAQRDAIMYSFRNRPNENHSVRCVYDVWYWGEEVPEEVTNVHTYYPGTLNPVE